MELRILNNTTLKLEIAANEVSNGMSDAFTDIVDLGMISRTIYEEEIAKSALYVSVSKDTVVITFKT